jgi:hypothetical protein
MTTTFDTIPKTAKELIKIAEDNYLSVHDVLSRVRELETEARDKVVIPEYQSKPMANSFYKNRNSPTSKEIKAYAKAVEENEKYGKKRYAAIKKQRSGVPRTGEILEGFIKEKSGLNGIPKQYRDGVYRFAWDKGHSSGYSEVYYYLQELVEIF